MFTGSPLRKNYFYYYFLLPFFRQNTDHATSLFDDHVQMSCSEEFTGEREMLTPQITLALRCLILKALF